MTELSDMSAAGRLSGLSAARAERAALACAVLAAVALLWLAPRPPMVDLPQHAAQVAAWRDLIAGNNLFADELRVNLATPYLVGYGLALPFAFLFEPASALRIVLSGALLGFFVAGQGLRRALDADPRLDWLWLAGFFGFAWQWGFFTFLVAAPILLLVARLQLRHAAAPTAGAALTLAAAGGALLFCHGLLFLFALVIGACLTLEILLRDGFAAALRRVAPYVAMLVMLAAFMALRAALSESAPATGAHFGEAPWLRPITALVFVWSASEAIPAALLTAVALAAPWLMGLRPTRRGGVALFAAVALVLAAAPDFAMGTGFLQQRFALFLAPFYGLMFARAPRGGFAPAQFALIGAVAAGLALTGARQIAFAREAQDFERALAAAEPGRRALALVFDRASAAAANPVAYLHWPAWYGADRRGFVDFSFAQFHPQVVRLKKGEPVFVGEQEGWRPQDFDWAGWRGDRYGYFFARGGEAEIAALRAKIPCQTRLTPAGTWTLIEPEGCAAQPAR
ncbi:MAG: hypothetical protein JNK46_13265 [Methylobacteriaceae bacterium]|nr:hypothetical protein [Methylobacteriaceae bacterium]